MNEKKESYKVVIAPELAPSLLPENFKAIIRTRAIINGGYQDDKTAVWELGDNELMCLIEEILELKDIRICQC